MNRGTLNWACPDTNCVWPEKKGFSLLRRFMLTRLLHYRTMLPLHQLCKSGQLNWRGVGRASKMTGLDVLPQPAPEKTLTVSDGCGWQTFKLELSQIANAAGISTEWVENIPHNKVGTSKVCAQWVPRLLKPDQKHTRLVVSQANLALCEPDPWFWNVSAPTMNVGSNTSSQRPNKSPCSGNTNPPPPHGGISNGCCTWLWPWTGWSPPSIFSSFGTMWQFSISQHANILG